MKRLGTKTNASHSQRTSSQSKCACVNIRRQRRPCEDVRKGLNIAITHTGSKGGGQAQGSRRGRGKAQGTRRSQAPHHPSFPLCEIWYMYVRIFVSMRVDPGHVQYICIVYIDLSDLWWERTCSFIYCPSYSRSILILSVMFDVSDASKYCERMPNVWNCANMERSLKNLKVVRIWYIYVLSRFWGGPT